MQNNKNKFKHIFKQTILIMAILSEQTHVLQINTHISQRSTHFCQNGTGKSEYHTEIKNQVVWYSDFSACHSEKSVGQSCTLDFLLMTI